MYPLVNCRSIHYEGFEIAVRSLLLVGGCMKNRISLIFESREGVLELIVLFKDN